MYHAKVVLPISSIAVAGSLAAAFTHFYQIAYGSETPVDWTNLDGSEI